MASNVLFPRSGGMEILGWLWQLGAQAPGTGTQQPFAAPRGPSAGSEGPGVPPCTSACPGPLGPGQTGWDLFARWPEGLRARPPPPPLFLLFLFLVCFFG